MKVFVSAKENECDDERAMAIEAIEQLQMEPQASESRGASPQPIKELNLERVRNSDLYIGIFKKIYSEPTKEEYAEAKKNHVPRLVYVKKLSEDERCELELERFLQEVKDAKYGVTICDYKNARELRDRIKHNIIVNVVTIYYRKGRDAELRETVEKKLPETTEKKIEPRLEINLPSITIAGVPFEVSASTVATTTKGFFDLLLIAPDGRRLWFPDPKSWKGAIDTGSLQLNNEKYESKWTAILPSSYPEGKYYAMIGLYDDDPQRNLVMKREGYIDIKGSPYQVFISLLREFIIRWPVYKQLMRERKLDKPMSGEISWYASQIATKLSVVSGLKEEEQIRKLSQDLTLFGHEVYTNFPTTISTTTTEIEKLVSRGEELSKLSEELIKVLELTSQ